MSSKKGSLINFYSAEDREKLLTFRHLSERRVKAKVIQVVVEYAAAAMPDVCEFARDFTYPGSIDRLCVDKTFCPIRLFSDFTIYCSCPTRIEKLRELNKKKEQT
jgi:hypothetical protein